MTRDMYNIYNIEGIKRKVIHNKTFTFKFYVYFLCEQSHGPSHDLILSLKSFSEIASFMPIGREFTQLGTKINK